MHDRATKLRRMNDEQLCAAMDSSFGKGVDEGLRMADEQAAPMQRAADEGVLAFIHYLEELVGTGNKIGRGTILQLHRELEHAKAAGLFGRVAQ